MGKADFDGLQATGRLPATGETFISPSSDYSSKYDGQMVELSVQPGTTDELIRIGVRNRSKIVIDTYPDMPLVAGDWGSSSACFKGERPIIKVGFGRGPALDIFNNSIFSFLEMP